MVKLKPGHRLPLLVLAGEWAAIGALAVILLVFLASTLDGLIIRDGQGAAVITSMLVDLANTDRGSNSVGELTTSATLTAIAQAKANDMAEKGYFAHTSPEGHSPWYWFQKGGYTFSYAGENLAVDFSDSADVERAWMNSPTHRANLLNQHFTQIGIATAVGTYQGRTTTFVVQEFGTPTSASVANAPRTTTVPEKPTEIALATTKPEPVLGATTEPKPVVPPAPKLAAATKPAVTAPKPQAAAPAASTTASSVATTTAVAATRIVPPAAQPEGLQALWQVFAASPKTTLRYAYYVFGLLILIAIVLETGLELKRHHLRHVGLAFGLLLAMAGLFMTADQLVFTDPIIVDSGASSGAV
ncbi:MAG: hypothetical protein JWL82_305 [Parcubacteria group bacterium]|nr:hypothetical protein [Parcubacteria group bacterium]